ncbi:peptidoglycan editing factor PgeF [Candidatus Ruminimicrobium bovinum]|uniref:peptidoglycan editing factor PgeF n=1 Tax=Candidatus Ruminimicrobium bovinum TaxID=3242779 RepID=UPI0039B9439E
MFVQEKNFKYFHITTTKQCGNMKDFYFREKFCINNNINPSKIVFASQIHGTSVQKVSSADANSFIPNCDGLITDDKNIYLCIFTADCMPVFMADKNKKAVALIHAGWRGLAAGILNNAVLSFKNNFNIEANNIDIYIGPHIKQCCYQVGEEVLNVFNVNNSNNSYLSLAQQAKKQLNVLGVKSVVVSPYCTYHNSEQFFSYRKEKTDGRIMSLIGL